MLDGSRKIFPRMRNISLMFSEVRFQYDCMIKNILLSLASLIIVIGFSYAADPTDAERLSASAAKWQKEKEACDGNYSYKVTDVRFTGYRAETVVVVKDNKVVERRFTVLDSGTGPASPSSEAWVETGKDLGKHKENRIEPQTLDSLYEVAKKIIETKPPAHQVLTLQFDERGLLRCYYLRDTRIADDAPMIGVRHIQLSLVTK